MHVTVALTILSDGMGGSHGTYGGGKNVYRVLMGKVEGKRIPGGPRHGWGDNVKMNVDQRGSKGVCWICVSQVRDHWWAVAHV